MPAMPRLELPSSPTNFKMLIGDDFIETSERDQLERANPAHCVPVSRYPRATGDDAASAVAAARRAHETGIWRNKTGAERAALLLKVAKLVEENIAEFSAIECLECGKPIAGVEREIRNSIGLWEYAATLARHVYGDTYDQLGPQTLGLVLRQPIGVVGIITPWNYPLLIVSQKVPFALAVGCCVVVKPSELTSGTALRLGELILEAGIPAGVVNIVAGYGPEVGQAICRSADVDMVSFTGSTRVGTLVGRLAGEALKRCSLELGGKSAHIVCADADLTAAAERVVAGATRNTGQACVSGSRLLVEKSIARDLTEAVVAQMESLAVGDPLDPETNIGPLISEVQRDRVSGYVAAGRNAGAKAWSRTPGREADLPGYFAQPTVFTDVTPDMTIAQEEIFGPVLSVMTFATDDKAIEIANGTMYGLAAGVWTKDVDRAFRFGRRLDVGTVEVNTYLAGAPELPLTGHRMSGLGHEKGRFAVEEFTELKTIQLQFSG